MTMRREPFQGSLEDWDAIMPKFAAVKASQTQASNACH
jgi:hypothetical protein